MFVVALLQRRPGSGLLFLGLGGAFVLFTDGAPTLVRAFCLWLPLAGLSAMAAGADAPRGPARDWSVGLLGLLWCLLTLPLLLSVLGVSLERRDALTACKSYLKNYGTALEMYSTDHEGCYPDELAQLTPEYLRELPLCPAVPPGPVPALLQPLLEPHPFGSRDYGYERVADESYRVWCRSNAHFVGPGYPQYTSETRLVEAP